MYSKNIIVRRNVKYRTVRIMEQVGRFIDLLAEKRIGIIRKGAFTRKRKLSYQSVFLTILDVGRETLQMKLARVLPKTGCEEECSQQAFSKGTILLSGSFSSFLSIRQTTRRTSARMRKSRVIS